MTRKLLNENVQTNHDTNGLLNKCSITSLMCFNNVHYFLSHIDLFLCFLIFSGMLLNRENYCISTKNIIHNIYEI